MPDIDLRFTYHVPRAEDIGKFSQIRGHAKALARTVDELAPVGREKSLALTKIEEAVMWANAAIARSGIPVEHDNATRVTKSATPGDISEVLCALRQLGLMEHPGVTDSSVDLSLVTRIEQRIDKDRRASENG